MSRRRVTAGRYLKSSTPGSVWYIPQVIFTNGTLNSYQVPEFSCFCLLYITLLSQFFFNFDFYMILITLFLTLILWGILLLFSLTLVFPQFWINSTWLKETSIFKIVWTSNIPYTESVFSCQTREYLYAMNRLLNPNTYRIIPEKFFDIEYKGRTNCEIALEISSTPLPEHS